MAGGEKMGNQMTGNAAVSAAGGKYLTFKLAKEEYGLEILKVREIICLMPDFIRGVINLRGAVIPVIELRKKFNMQIIEDSGETCIIVVEITKANMPVCIGILVDSVSEVMDIAFAEIQETPSFGVDIDTRYILGMAKARESVKILLDIQKLLTENEISIIKEIGDKV
jgi:purine-binding chemotaxis protein CheW